VTSKLQNEAVNKEEKKIQESVAPVIENSVKDKPVNETPVEEMLGALSLDNKSQKTNTKECQKCKELEARQPPDSFLTVSQQLNLLS